MKSRSWRVSLAWCATALLAASAAGCGQGATSAAPDEGGLDARQNEPDVGTEDGSVDAPSVVTTDAATDAFREAATSDANVCLRDSSEMVCCCEGDLGADVVCNADGHLSCAGSANFPATLFTIYYGDDCTRECGPCSIGCPIDAGSHADASADTGVDAH